MIAPQSDYVHQSGVIAWRVRRGRVEVALVTARQSDRWGIPKGHVEPDLRPHASAAKEAYEEAGLVGQVDNRCIGSYQYEKRGRVCRVELYLLNVERVLSRWPEMHVRRRIWVETEQALAQVKHAELCRCIQRAERLVKRSLSRARIAAAA